MDELRWHIVLSLAGAEWQAHKALLRKDLESYFPYILGDARRGRWVQGVVRPQFPGYLFVGLMPDQTVAQVEDTTGVKEVLRVNNEYIRLSDAQMAKCREDCHARWKEGVPHRTERMRYHVGQVVPVPYGPFINIPCLIEGIDTKSGRVYAVIGSIPISFMADGPPVTQSREPVRASAAQ